MREKISLDEKWLFHKGDIEMPFPNEKNPIYLGAKTERMFWGPAAANYTDRIQDEYGSGILPVTEPWEYVDLPHDYIIKEIPSKENNEGLGFVKCDNAWYRKAFTLEECDRDKRITLYFEGVATHATVYLNGCLMKHNFSGYTSFEVDITDYVKFGKRNMIAVYVEGYGHEGWWYEGGGIYRHVWLIKTETVSVDLYGVYVKAMKINEDTWRTEIETTVRNDRYNDENVRAVTYIKDQKGDTVSALEGKSVISAREKQTIKYSSDIKNPMLWDIEDPNLYTAETVLYINKKEVDIYETRFGFRTFTCDKDKGLFLNGKHVKIKGVCAHGDFGLTGKALSDNIARHRVELIKEMGANGFRTSHYPHSEATMDALDELGFIVMDETRWFESTDDGLEQLRMLVKRDRNRPSVLFWSIGNEEPYHITDEGRRIAKSMASEVKKLDDTRLVMTAVSYDPINATVNGELDAIGINYNLDTLDPLHEKYPDQPIVSSECCATATTRGWYFDSFPEKAFHSAYDSDMNNGFSASRERTWKFISEREWCLGEYQWIAFEHRGEAAWPRICSQSGAIDLYLQKKDAFYQNRSHWIENEPVIHLLPHWSFNGFEGEPIKIYAYSNCTEAELFLNGESQGVSRVEKFTHHEWTLPYVPGEIRVVGLKDGAVVCEDLRRTCGKAKKLNLVLENKIEKANGADIALVSCYCTDENGTEVPNAAAYISISSNSLGSVIGTGSDITDHTPPCITERKMRAGRLSAAIKVGKTKGKLKIYASAENMESALLTVDLI